MKLRLSGGRSTAYEQVIAGLRTSYDAGAEDRDAAVRPDWKLDERAAFLDRLRAAEARTLLEVGAGTGQDSAWFQAEGLRVTAVASLTGCARIARRAIRSAKKYEPAFIASEMTTANTRPPLPPSQ